jgi:hypothetical protein
VLALQVNKVPLARRVLLVLPALPALLPTLPRSIQRR